MDYSEVRRMKICHLYGPKIPARHPAKALARAYEFELDVAFELLISRL